MDALVLRGDEGRGTLRKAAGRGERPLIRGYPNGETPPFAASPPQLPVIAKCPSMAGNLVALAGKCRLGGPVGGGERDRTDDLLLAKQALSQLSYTPFSGDRDQKF